MHTFLKSLHFASLLAVVTIGYKFSTFVVIALHWNVIDGKSPVRIRRRVEKCVVLKRGEKALLKHSNFSVFLLLVVMFKLFIRRSWKLVFTKKKSNWNCYSVHTFPVFLLRSAVKYIGMHILYSLHYHLPHIAVWYSEESCATGFGSNSWCRRIHSPQ
jgi:hypothetical protein